MCVVNLIAREFMCECVLRKLLVASVVALELSELPHSQAVVQLIHGLRISQI